MCAVPPMQFGSMPNDGGFLLLTDQEREEILAESPEATNWIRQCVGSDEYLNGVSRWCLWLVGIPPETLRQMTIVTERVQAVRRKRLESTRPATRRLAETPSLFGEIRQPVTDFLLVPSVSSEDRRYLAVGFMSSDVIATNLCLMVAEADDYLFGIVSSTMHMAWVRNIGGRLKSDYRYSATITYNPFPFPAPSPAQRERIADAARALLDVRAGYRDTSLAVLYNPETMPPELALAHSALDRTVDRTYRSQAFADDMERARFLLLEYQRLNAPLDARPTARERSRPSRSRRQRD